MRFRSTAIVVLCLGLATLSTARAEFGRLGGTTLSEAFTGATIDLDTPIAGMKIAVKYLPGGHLAGDANAMLAISLGAPKDHGRWWVDGDKLCHKWFKWFDAAVQCLKISRDGPHLRWVRDDGETGTATIEDRLADLGASPSGLGVPPPTQDAAPLAEPAPAMAPVMAPVIAPAPVPETQAAIEPAQTQTPAQTLAPERNDESALAPSAPATEPVETHAKPARAKTIAVVAPQAKPAVRFGGPSYRIAGVADDDVLNVRETPSPTSRVIGAISPLGKGVRITGNCVNTWCPVAHASGFGWVNRIYLVAEVGPDRRRADADFSPRR